MPPLDGDDELLERVDDERAVELGTLVDGLVVTEVVMMADLVTLVEGVEDNKATEDEVDVSVAVESGFTLLVEKSKGVDELAGLVEGDEVVDVSRIIVEELAAEEKSTVVESTVELEETREEPERVEEERAVVESTEEFEGTEEEPEVVTESAALEIELRDALEIGIEDVVLKLDVATEDMGELAVTETFWVALANADEGDTVAEYVLEKLDDELLLELK